MSNVGKTPNDLGIKKGTRIGPEGGWKPSTYYIAETAASRCNSIHKVIFYSGFLSNEFPCGYNCILSPTYDREVKITDTWYMKVVEELDINLKG